LRLVPGSPLGIITVPSGSKTAVFDQVSHGRGSGVALCRAVSARSALPHGAIRGGPLQDVADIAPHAAHGMGRDGGSAWAQWAQGPPAPSVLMRRRLTSAALSPVERQPPPRLSPRGPSALWQLQGRSASQCPQSDTGSPVMILRIGRRSAPIEDWDSEVVSSTR
jgi:hypothetical protein